MRYKVIMQGQSSQLEQPVLRIIEITPRGVSTEAAMMLGNMPLHAVNRLAHRTVQILNAWAAGNMDAARLGLVFLRGRLVEFFGTGCDGWLYVLWLEARVRG